MSEKDSITITDVIDHYNIIGLGIAVSIGLSGKELIYSFTDDFLLPLFGTIFEIKFLSKYKFDLEKLISALVTFCIVVGIVILMLYTVLKPLVEEEIRKEKTD